MWPVSYSAPETAVAYCSADHHPGAGVMRSILLGAAALGGVTIPATCADLRPLYKEAPAVPLWNWTGCYIGGHAGGVWATQKNWIVKTPGGAFYGQSLGEHATDGSLGGVQAGCDYQFAGGFVTGIQ